MAERRKDGEGKGKRREEKKRGRELGLWDMSEF